MPQAAQLADGGMQQLDPEATLLAEGRAVLLGKAAPFVWWTEEWEAENKEVSACWGIKRVGKGRVSLSHRSSGARKGEGNSEKGRELRSLRSEPGYWGWGRHGRQGIAQEVLRE